MRHLILVCIALVFTSCTPQKVGSPARSTFSSFDRPVGKGADVLPAGHILLKEVDVDQVLALYSDLSGRTNVRSPQLPAARISLRNANAVNRIEALQLLDTTLAASGVVMVLAGDHAVKAVLPAALPQESPPVIDSPADQLPDSKSVMVRHVKLQHVTPEQMTGLVAPFATLPNSIVSIRDSNMLILRDYSSSIRQMLRVIDEAEKNWKDGSPGTVRR